MPRLNGRRRTIAPWSAAISAVRSVEPSSTTTITNPGSKSRISSITRPTLPSSFSAGRIAIRSDTGAPRRDPGGEADQLEEPPRPMEVGVLVEDALAGPPPQLLGKARIRQQHPVRLDRLARVGDEQQLALRLEPALDPRVRA